MSAANRTRKYVSMNLMPAARDALQGATLKQSAAVNQRLSLSEVLIAAVAVAEAHPDELAAALAANHEEDE